MKRAVLGLVGVAGLLALSGCGGLGDGGSGTRVVAAFYPYAYVAERVAGEHADVDNLTAPGVEPHDIELSPKQVAEISEADLVIYQDGFQPAIGEAVEQNSPRLALDVTEVVDAHEAAAAAESGSSSVEGDAADQQLSEEAVSDGEHDDPHLWLDPTLLIPIAEQVAADLAEIDPEHAADFRANAQSLADDLRSLDRDFSQGLEHCDRTAFVTSHAAFGYLAHRYGLEMVPIASLSPDVEPSPQQLAEVQDLIDSAGITTVFSEALGSQEYADTLAGDLGVRTAVLDPLEGLADEDAGGDYFSLMRDNLRALEEANGCS